MHETLFYLVSCKKFLLALIFASLNRIQLGRVNHYQVYPISSDYIRSSHTQLKTLNIRHFL
jgi:hypothetical protein